MPRKIKQPEPLGKPENPISPFGRYYTDEESEWGGFINIHLNDTDRSAFHQWTETTGNEYFQDLDDLMGQGMKVGSSYDKINECYIVTLTGRPSADMNFRCCMTTRAGTWAEAMALAVFKHLIFCKGNWLDYLPNQTRKKNAWG